MVEHGGSSAGSYLADPTSPIPSHCASIVATSTVRVNNIVFVSDRTWYTHRWEGRETLVFGVRSLVRSTATRFWKLW